MISRRNIRVKVMQTLYSVENQEELSKPGVPAKLLEKQFDQSRQLFVFLVYFLTEVARYAEKDAKTRASKHLPTQKDLEVNTKISGNELLWKIVEYPSFKLVSAQEKPHLVNDPELLRKVYSELVNTEQYQAYILNVGREKKDEKEILEFILTDLMLPNEEFTGFLEDKFTNWDDD